MDLKVYNENKENKPDKIIGPLKMADPYKGPSNEVECKMSCDKELHSRLPLKELNAASGSKYLPNRFNTMHVTRQNTLDLEWTTQAFRECKKDVGKDTQSRVQYDYNVKENDLCHLDNSERNGLGESSRDLITPTVGLENKKIKNVKQSLKRPHSRELQGLSPVFSGGSGVKRRLSFNEVDDVQNKFQCTDWLTKVHMTCLKDYTLDVFQHLLTIEKKLRGTLATVRSATRACVINWLIKINGCNGNPAIVQSACWYLDSILAREEVAIEKLQLLATACYWIAQKQDGPASTSLKLTRVAGHAFTIQQLTESERSILKTLNFPSKPVVPQDYITYLSWWCDNSFPGEIEVAATFICLSGIMLNKTIHREYPSVVAAACVKNALLLLRKVDLIDLLRTCPVYQHAKTKATHMAYTTSMLRTACKTAPKHSNYRAPYDIYGKPPHYTSKKVVVAAESFAIIDKLNAKR